MISLAVKHQDQQVAWPLLILNVRDALKLPKKMPESLKPKKACALIGGTRAVIFALSA